jgi:methylated-DNA-[protein]-cysteine S-methyltransferase
MSLAVAVLPAPGPMGALTIGVGDAGLAFVAFGDVPALAERAADRLGTVVTAAGPTEAGEQLTAYLAGELRRFTTPLDWSLTSGTQRRVLEVLSATVPFGATVTYGELATRSGTVARGVGSIMGSNPLPVVVPCHRVLGADGLGGFGGGRATKEWLLALEGVLTPTLDFG